MGKSKMFFPYRVLCSIAIAKEMARYEGATILSSDLIPPRNDFEESFYLEYPDNQKGVFVLSTQDLIEGRWLSFGVRPKVL